MSAPASKVLVKLADEAGKTCTWSFWVPFTTDASATAITNVINALIAALPLQVLGHQLEEEAGLSVGTATTGDYTALDKLVIKMRNNVTGQVYTHKFPAPKTTAFLADGETLDPADSNNIALIAALNANVVGTNGEACTYVSGRRDFGRRKIHTGT